MPKGMVAFCFTVFTSFFSSYVASDTGEAVFEVLGKWERRIINGPDGRYITEIHRTRNKKGGLFVFHSAGRYSDAYITIFPNNHSACVDGAEWLFVGLNTEFFVPSKCHGGVYTLRLDGSQDVSKLFSAHRVVIFNDNDENGFDISNIPFVGVGEYTKDEIYNILKRGRLPLIKPPFKRIDFDGNKIDCRDLYRYKLTGRFDGVSAVRVDSGHEYHSMIYGRTRVTGVYCDADQSYLYQSEYR
ncbi:TPA: hypothetical protein R5X29_000702 [Enterobacter sichuanensis]|nr:hypothetical protein [Enterobacter sichuanensis]